jgi:TPR repeat protein
MERNSRRSEGRLAYLREDYTAAMRILKPLAEQGDMNAQFMVGTLYDNGYGVPIDATEAALWFRKAAEQGHTLAATSLGMLTLYGDGVPQNYADRPNREMPALSPVSE